VAAWVVGKQKIPKTVLQRLAVAEDYLWINGDHRRTTFFASVCHREIPSGLSTVGSFDGF
jgi:hypothetical protein